MKKFLTLICAMSVVLWACDEQLEITPVDQLDAGVVFETVNDLEVGMNGLYALFDPEDAIRHSSVFTDDTKIGADNGGQLVTLHRWIIDPGQNSAGIWNNHFATVALANRLLLAAEGIAPEGADETATYNRLLGEARFWRAFATFQMTMFYAPDFQDGTLAVPYIKDVIVLEEPARNTVGEVFTEIKADLNEAANLIPATGVGVDRINQDAINALRARLALIEGDYATALNLSTQLLGTYPIADRTQYTEIFQDLSNQEVIWELVKENNDGTILAGGVWYFTGTGGAFMEMSKGFYDIIDAADVRSDVLIDQANTDDSQNLHFIGKYLGKGGINFLNDYKMFRSSEMLLIRAESQARTGDLGGAATTIQSLRNARIAAGQPLPNYANVNAALTDILAERRLELAYEGFRFIDLKRLSVELNMPLTRDANDCGNGTPCALDLNDPRWAIAIPDGEIDANSNVVQNPGY